MAVNNNPLISVIVPVYNVERFLDDCVNSIVRQSYQNLDIILVDDGSSDRSPQLCDAWKEKDARIRVVHKPNGGQSSARNMGIDVAKGAYIGFVDSDDIITENYYQVLVDNISDEKTLPCVAMVRMDETGVVLNARESADRQFIDSKGYVRSLLMYIGNSSACCRLFPKKVFDTFRFDENLLNEDYKFMSELGLNGYSILETGYVGYHYRVRSGSTTTSFGKGTEDTIVNCLTVGDEILEKYPDLAKEVARFRLYQHMIYLLSYPLDRKYNSQSKEVLSYLRKNILSNLFNKYLTVAVKAVILVQCVAPRLPSKLYRISRNIKSKA